MTFFYSLSIEEDNENELHGVHKQDQIPIEIIVSRNLKKYVCDFEF